MNRIWINYTLWEDYKAGLYSKTKQDEEIVGKVIAMFENPMDFFAYAQHCLEDWPNSMDQNLSYEKSNRRSYLGQATACYKFGANIVTTCKAWERLTPLQRDIANEMADCVISIYDSVIYPTKTTKEINEELS